MAVVVAVSQSPVHRFSKESLERIELVAGEGVAGDAHRGVTVKHRSRVRVDPTRPNLRQVHLIQAELIHELQGKGFRVSPGVMGENITTSGLDLLALPTGTRIHVEGGAVLELTGLRNPCAQLDHYQQGLTAAVLDRDEQGRLVRKAGVMAVVQTGGVVVPGAAVRVELPPSPHRPLAPV
ncbi:MAG TPA: MOSC domain-containing protein [Geminicoccus sp.]|jgi:MOSC domain-containing protein YiiM|uniref:MOSC domain-containing protein n=1 Tax=Geminicoccus sp. TaxID=2024832 RepID=UPI002E309258|nr:MOSC domain-containing protein [Geminicoccus sp.]HEX2525974.1 MOSC domain-containing protein [Geminicoccus sp.]